MKYVKRERYMMKQKVVPDKKCKYTLHSFYQLKIPTQLNTHNGSSFICHDDKINIPKEW